MIIAPKPALSSNGGIPSGLYLIYVLFEGYLIRAGGAGHEPEAVVEKLLVGTRASGVAMTDMRPCECKDAPRMSPG